MQGRLNRSNSPQCEQEEKLNLEEEENEKTRGVTQSLDWHLNWLSAVSGDYITFSSTREKGRRQVARTEGNRWR